MRLLHFVCDLGVCDLGVCDLGVCDLGVCDLGVCSNPLQSIAKINTSQTNFNKLYI